MSVVAAAEQSPKVEDLRQRLYDLRREREDENNYQSRLKAKVDKLEASVRQIREEIQHTKQKKNLEETREGQENQAKEREHEAKVKNQDERIRDHLSEVLYTQPPGDRRVFELHTVQVSFDKVDKKSFRYLLAFRIDDGTKVEELRTNACKYWGLEKDNYILKTMANNKCQDKVLVKSCFKQGEIAQLRLEPKSWDVSEPAEEEWKAIQPKSLKSARKGAGGARSVAAAGKSIDKLQKFSDSYATNLARMGGVYFLLKQRDQKPTEHVGKITLRDIVAYLTMIVCTFVVYAWRRPEAQAFWLRMSFQAELFRRVGDDLASFEEISQLPELKDWLTYTLPEVIWSTADRSLGAYNTLPGYLAIRVQNLEDPGSPESSCPGHARLVASIGGGATCYNSEKLATGTITNVSQYWETVSGEDPSGFRGPANPGIWTSAESNEEEHWVTELWGQAINYDASGYSVYYRMRQADAEQSRKAYSDDMAYLTEAGGWISLATRVVIVSLNAYNFNYDMWISCDLVFEVPASAAVSQHAILRPYMQRTTETSDQQDQQYIDFFRILIAVYIFFVVGFKERKHKTKNHKGGYLYYASLTGLSDVSIVVCTFVIVIWRHVQFEGKTTSSWLNEIDDAEGTRGFLSFSSKAFNYEMVFVLEGVLMLFLMFRLLSFFRLSRQFYLMWHTLGRTMQSLVFFVFLFGPALFGFTLIMSKVFGGVQPNFSLPTLTVLELFNLMSGTADTSALSDTHEFWAVFLLVSFYFVFNFGLLNMFVMAVVEAYYVVHLTQGGPGEKWSTKRWKQWVLPAMFTTLSNEWSKSRKDKKDKDASGDARGRRYSR